jgi:hypothetical protein
VCHAGDGNAKWTDYGLQSMFRWNKPVDCLFTQHDLIALRVF